MLQPIYEQYFEVGYIARSHGVKGEVLINTEIESPELFNDVDLVHIKNTRGDLIPARIESVRVQEKNNRLSFFVKFEHVSDRNQAEKLKNFPVYVDRDIVSRFPGMGDDEPLPDFVSFEVLDENERYVGKVTGVMENPAHLILEINTEHGSRLLVPFVDEYVLATDEETSTITCRNLSQLTDEL